VSNSPHVDGSPDALHGMVAYVRDNEGLIAYVRSFNLWVHPGRLSGFVRAKPEYAADVMSDLRPPDKW
jgi:hypothetical protein